MIPYWGCWGWICGLWRSPKWPRSRRKKIDQKSWNWQFLSYKNVTHLKRKLRTIVIQIWNKIRVFCTEKIEKKSILQFWSYTNIIYLKRKLRTIVIQIWKKIRGFCYKNLKKNRFCDFRSQKIIISARSRLNFWKTCQDSKKIT